MAVKWFYGAEHARLGPFSAQELKELKQRGRLHPTDMVWKEGVLNGLLASKIHGLFGIIDPSAVIVEVACLPVLKPVPAVERDLPIACQNPPVEEQLPDINPVNWELGLVPIDDDTPLNVAALLPVVEQSTEPSSEHWELGLVPIDDDILLSAGAVAQVQDISSSPAPETGPSPLEKISAPSSDIPEQATVPPEKTKPRVVIVRVKRAQADSGAILISQDGERVRFRKKCIRCAYEDTVTSVLRMMPGINRQQFFCPKCRKQVAITIRVL
ncbi:hypothetical protein BH10PLA2_BH10PLA2_09140 [soil metagenome]